MFKKKNINDKEWIENVEKEIKIFPRTLIL